MIVLTLNSGSSSLKFGLYEVDGAKSETLMTGGSDRGRLMARDAAGRPLPGLPCVAEDRRSAFQAMAALLARGTLPAPDAVGHRIVHGGPNLLAHCLIDATVESELAAAGAMAPLHAPASLELIDLARKSWPDLPQVACIDTVFHAAMPAVARTLPVASELRSGGVQRYGFHGLSCESIIRQFGVEVPERLIIAHLGSGCSVTAVREGISIDTSMGLTPSGGVIMATRSGDLDPGLLIYLLRERRMDADALEVLLDKKSGLLGISELSSDLRDLWDAAASNSLAKLAIDVFCTSVAKQVAAMTVALGAVDTIVFTGGIGEHAADVRSAICGRLECFGVRLDSDANSSGKYVISDAEANPQVLVFPAREDEQIAFHVSGLVAAGLLVALPFPQ